MNPSLHSFFFFFFYNSNQYFRLHSWARHGLAPTLGCFGAPTLTCCPNASSSLTFMAYVPRISTCISFRSRPPPFQTFLFQSVFFVMRGLQISTSQPFGGRVPNTGRRQAAVHSFFPYPQWRSAAHSWLRLQELTCGYR